MVVYLRFNLGTCRILIAGAEGGSQVDRRQRIDDRAVAGVVGAMTAGRNRKLTAGTPAIVGVDTIQTGGIAVIAGIPVALKAAEIRVDVGFAVVVAVVSGLESDIILVTVGYGNRVVVIPDSGYTVEPCIVPCTVRVRVFRVQVFVLIIRNPRAGIRKAVGTGHGKGLPDLAAFRPGRRTSDILGGHIRGGGRGSGHALPAAVCLHGQVIAVVRKAGLVAHGGVAGFPTPAAGSLVCADVRHVAAQKAVYKAVFGAAGNFGKVAVYAQIAVVRLGTVKCLVPRNVGGGGHHLVCLATAGVNGYTNQAHFVHVPAHLRAAGGAVGYPVVVKIGAVVGGKGHIVPQSVFPCTGLHTVFGGRYQHQLVLFGGLHGNAQTLQGTGIDVDAIPAVIAALQVHNGGIDVPSAGQVDFQCRVCPCAAGFAAGGCRNTGCIRNGAAVNGVGVSVRKHTVVLDVYGVIHSQTAPLVGAGIGVAVLYGGILLRADAAEVIFQQGLGVVHAQRHVADRKHALDCIPAVVFAAGHNSQIGIAYAHVQTVAAHQTAMGIRIRKKEGLAVLVGHVLPLRGGLVVVAPRLVVQNCLVHGAAVRHGGRGVGKQQHLTVGVRGHGVGVGCTAALCAGRGHNLQIRGLYVQDVAVACGSVGYKAAEFAGVGVIATCGFIRQIAVPLVHGAVGAGGGKLQPEMRPALHCVYFV